MQVIARLPKDFQVHMHAAGMQESCIRGFTVTAAGASSSSRLTEVAQAASGPKHCPNGAFSGSQASFQVSSAACAPLGALDAVQAALEVLTIVAPPVEITLRIDGFEAAAEVYFCALCCSASNHRQRQCSAHARKQQGRRRSLMVVLLADDCSAVSSCQRRSGTILSRSPAA